MLYIFIIQFKCCGLSGPVDWLNSSWSRMVHINQTVRRSYLLNWFMFDFDDGLTASLTAYRRQVTNSDNFRQSMSLF